MNNETEQKLQKFLDNHELGSLPEKRDERLYEFIIQSHKEGKDIRPEDLALKMEQKGFADVLTRQYVDTYITGIGLLKKYDETQ